MSRLIAAPLLTKLVVCDLALNGLALVIVSDAPAEYAAEITIAALLVTLVINAVLVYWALLPLRELEEAASRVSAGRLEARVRYSTLADRNILRIAKALNQLLDHVTADRVRMRHLASQVISAATRNGRTSPANCTTALRSRSAPSRCS
jgi:methyl-accepting chemotaxis protein